MKRLSSFLKNARFVFGVFLQLDGFTFDMGGVSAQHMLVNQAIFTLHAQKVLVKGF